MFVSANMVFRILNTSVRDFFSGADPFRLMALPIRRNANFYTASAIDLHVNQRIDFEVSRRVITAYLPQKACGNTLLRLYTNLQHYFSSDVEAINGSGERVFSFSRSIINLFAAMADGSPQVPAVLRTNDYSIHSIEKTFTVELGKKVNAELILCSESAEHTLVVDAKSGANLSPKQLERYASITAKSLLNSAFVPKKASGSHNVLFVGQDIHAQRLLLGSAAVPSDNRVISLAAGPALNSVPPTESMNSLASVLSGIRMIENQFVPACLNQAFQPILPVDWDIVPVNYLPVDHEAEDWEFAERLIPELMMHIQAGRETVKLDELGTAIVGLWPLFVADYKKQMTTRLETIVKIAAQSRFAEFLNYGEKGFSRREVRLKVPSRLQSKPAALRASLARQARSLLEDLQSPQIAMVYDPNGITI